MRSVSQNMWSSQLWFEWRHWACCLQESGHGCCHGDTTIYSTFKKQIKEGVQSILLLGKVRCVMKSRWGKGLTLWDGIQWTLLHSFIVWPWKTNLAPTFAKCKIGKTVGSTKGLWELWPYSEALREGRSTEPELTPCHHCSLRNKATLVPRG